MENRSLGGSTGVRLHTSAGLSEWSKWLSDSRNGPRAPIDWMLAVEALSDPRAQVTRRHIVHLKDVADALGEGIGTVREGGAVYSKYTSLWKSLRHGESRDTLGNTGDARTRLYRQARVATFLRYRDGFVEHLAAVPFSAEVALHAYLRIVVEWAIRWRGLTLATPSERASSLARYRSAPGRNRVQQADEAERSWVSIPMIVEDDIRALLELARLEAGDVTSASDIEASKRDWHSPVAIDALCEQLIIAVKQVLRDPTITALTAGNTARHTANNELGGALQRLRVRAEDQQLIEQQFLEEAYKAFVESVAQQASPDTSLKTAIAEEMFHKFKIVLTGLSGSGPEE